MKSPIEQLRDKAIRRLPKPSPLANFLRYSLTHPQCESLMDLFLYLHGSSHGYGQQGPIRRRLQDKGLLKPKDDGWIPTKLGYEVISVLIKEREQEIAIDAEIKSILSLTQRMVAHRDWDQLMRAVNASRNKGSAIKLIRKLLPGIEYQKDDDHPLGGRFKLPLDVKASEFHRFLVEKSLSGARLGYAD